VVLWSREPFEEVDTVGHPDLPPGRFVTGVSMGIRFVGVCIPWRMAHVNNGQRNRKPWEDHLRYWDGVWRLILEWRCENRPVCLLGDINQTSPVTNQPQNVFREFAMLHSLWENWTLRSYPEERVLDHIFTNAMARAVPEELIPKQTGEGLRLSDHIGIPFRFEAIRPDPDELSRVGALERELKEEEVLAAAALRVDGYTLREDKGYTREKIEALIRRYEQGERDLDLPVEIKWCAFFHLQRFLCKWGGESLNQATADWRAYRQLFLELVRRDPPDRHQTDHIDWRGRFAPRVEECVAVVSFRHRHTLYAKPFPQD
jgi:hypothetical protein